MRKIVKNASLGLVIITLVSITFATAQIPLLPTNSLEFKTNASGPVQSSLNRVAVADQPFKTAYRVSCLNITGSERFTLRHPIDAPVRKGDVLLFSFYSRSLQSKKETGESFIEVSLDRTVEGKYAWPPLLERGISFGPQWVLTQIPFVASRDVAKGELSLVIKCGNYPQLFELAEITLVNYEHTKSLADLPRSVVHYDGDAPDAAWRKAAEERINKYRKGDLTVQVLDRKGKPIPNASVSVAMKRSAFGWGTATNSKLLLDTLNPEARQYRDTLIRYFNKVVFENEMKSKYWAASNHEQTKQAGAWLRTHHIPARGHVMVWPSWEHSPNLVKFKPDSTALDAAILALIGDQTTVMKGQFIEWDVVNEPFAHHNVMDSLGGKKKLVEWFRVARKNTPGVRLFLNEYTMFHPEGKGSDDFYNNIQYLLDNKAPIDGIGEQGHIGGTPPGIEFIISKLDRFAKFGLPIQISEFDITSDDDDFKTRYMRDFMIAIFSHPATIGFIQWGFWEKAHWIPAAALWDNDWHIRPQGKVFTDLVTKTWWTDADLTTSINGTCQVRGFCGDYIIQVSHKGKTTQQTYSLGNKGGTLVIGL